jgi:hypothetical protein
LSRLDGPVVTFARVVLGALDLDEVLVQAEVVANAVLPTALGQTVKGEVVRDPLIDLGKREATILRAQDGHANQCCITEGRFSSIVGDRWHLTGIGQVERLFFFVLLLLLLRAGSVA